MSKLIKLLDANKQQRLHLVKALEFVSKLPTSVGVTPRKTDQLHPVKAVAGSGGKECLEAFLASIEGKEDAERLLTEGIEKLQTRKWKLQGEDGGDGGDGREDSKDERSDGEKEEEGDENDYDDEDPVGGPLLTCSPFL